jgi:exodeoxyribonuclease V beta subunit
LDKVSWEDRLSELEFDFPLTEFVTNRLGELSDGTDTPFFIRPNEQLEGIMNGKVDLVFRFGGKYWILDWKSNHLGDRVEDYSVSRVREAMGDNNYHLQYHIYTVALRKHLRACLPDFDYERDFGGCIYLFVRGMRVGADTGIFFRKPEVKLIDQMEELLSGKVLV